MYSHDYGLTSHSYALAFTRHTHTHTSYARYVFHTQICLYWIQTKENDIEVKREFLVLHLLIYLWCFLWAFRCVV